VPLYACERCGFTSAAFRNAAAAAHRFEYPDCDGVIRIIFRSEDRYRGAASAPAAGFSQTAAPSSREGHAPPTQTRRHLAMRERPDPDGTLVLTLLGDLDLTTAETLSTRLAELKTAGHPVRLDLSQLSFIDSSGIQAVLAALTDARWTGWQLDVALQVSPTVERAANVVGIAQVLWPDEPTPSRPAPRIPKPTSST
jgi:stage II sporulation protein AA (anti-sigma F factor antagonist)